MVSSNVTELTFQGCTFYVVGTAHVSKQSVEEVRALIHDLSPDTVCVELDASRYQQLTAQTGPTLIEVEAHVRRVLAEGRAFSALVSLALAAFQQRMGKQLGITPGAELLAGVNAAEAVGARVVLADRDVQVTLSRCWGNLTLFDKFQVASTLLLSMAVNTQLSQEQVEALKNRENIGNAMGEFAKHFPRLQIPLIDERDRYLSHELQTCGGQRVVAVVGAGHVAGIQQYLNTTINREELLKLPAPDRLLSLKRCLPLAIFLLLALGSLARDVTWLWSWLRFWYLSLSLLSLFVLQPVRPSLRSGLLAPLLAPFSALVGRAGDLAARLELPPALQRARTAVPAAVSLADETRVAPPVQAMDSFKTRRAHPFTQVLQTYALAHGAALLGVGFCSVVWLYHLLFH